MAKTMTASKLAKMIKDRFAEYLKNGCGTMVCNYPYDFDDEHDGALTSQDLDVFSEACSMVRASRSVEGVKIAESRSKWERVFIVWAKPCKEFVQLNKWLVAHKCDALSASDCRLDAVSGKRSSYGLDHSKWLAHDAGTCARMLDWLKRSVKGGRRLSITFDERMHWGDRFDSYGMDLESEWSGHRARNIVARVLTPTGREADKMVWYVDRYSKYGK